MDDVEVSRSLGGCSQAAERKTWEPGRQDFFSSVCGKPEGRSTERVTEGMYGGRRDWASDVTCIAGRGRWPR